MRTYSERLNPSDTYHKLAMTAMTFNNAKAQFLYLQC